MHAIETRGRRTSTQLNYPRCSIVPMSSPIGACFMPTKATLQITPLCPYRLSWHQILRHRHTGPPDEWG